MITIITTTAAADVVLSAALWDRLSECLMNKLKESLNGVDARFSSVLSYVMHERLRRMQSRYVDGPLVSQSVSRSVRQSDSQSVSQLVS